MNLPLEKQFTGCLIGLCLGDALGFRAEGDPPTFCRRYVDEVLRDETARQNLSRNWKFGQYSDDGQLARELLRSYVVCRGFDPSHYARLISSIFSGRKIVGRGRGTTEAAQRLAQGISWEAAGMPPPYAGNGSASRAGPIGLIFYDAPIQMVQAAHDQSRITHQDRRCSAGAIAIAGAVALALQDEPIKTATICLTLSNLTRPFDHVLATALANQMPEWILLPPEKE